MMKKSLYIFLFLGLIGCKSSDFAIKSSDITIQYRDDFKSISDKEKLSFLKENNATSENKSVVLLTQGFKGEKIMIKQNDKTIYSSYPITNLNTKIADYIAFSNAYEVIVFDNFTKKEIQIPSDKSKKYKFIYLMKEYKDSNIKYSITYSNTLRPLK